MKKIVILSMLISVFACSSGGGSDEPAVKKDPTVASLVFPTANSECTEGTNKTTTESTIKFEWTAGANTDNYGLIVKNLSSGLSTTYSTSKTYYELKLARGIGYSWYVISSASGTSVKATSETRKFYNAGEGSSSYAPFPAEIVSPKINESISGTSITLDWTGSDVDNDIASYELFLGTTNTPGSYKTNITDNILNNVPVESGKTYYWKIVTKDSKGNTSVSDVFVFKVK
jgi:hypothetical protein